MHLYFDRDGIIRLAMSRPVRTNRYEHVEVDDSMISGNPVGRRVVRGEKPGSGRGMRLAVICNWGDACGIATYSGYLLDAMRPLVDDMAIFAEDNGGVGKQGGIDVRYTWKRGQSMAACMRELVAWKPTIVLIQHEFGIFPRAPYLLQVFQALDGAAIPHAVTLHSVYEHLDKVVHTGVMRNIVVHSESGRDCLVRHGHRAEIEVIPHGCLVLDDVSENWNITQTPYALLQFGFGFEYKGVDVALEAIARLKGEMPGKYGDGSETPIHYCYLCSESPHVRNAINNTYRKIMAKIDELGLADNAVVIRGFQSDEVLNQYLRTYKLAVFPYVTDPKNIVYGASGAVRVAMANRIPTIASASHMFDDCDGVLPRPPDSAGLAKVIDGLFSDHSKRERLIKDQDDYIRKNSWENIASHYRAFLASRCDTPGEDAIFIGR